MSNKRITRDELYLITVQKEADKLGDRYHEVDRYSIGQMVKQNDKSVDNIVRMLAQTNFVKLGDGNGIYITELGEVLVEELVT